MEGLIDTHAHLDFEDYDQDRQEVLQRAREAGVSRIVNIGTDLSSSRRALELSQYYPELYATVGIHPHQADRLDQEALTALRDLAKADRVVAIGEIGLDFHYDNSPRDIQREAFRQQLKLARELKLPVVIHSREADRDTMDILKSESAGEIGGILHCFAGDLRQARAALDLGFYIAFGGIITFNNAGNLREVVAELPLSRLLVETDAPFLTPHPHRGHRNEPAYVALIAEKIAEIKEIPAAEVARVTGANARKVYRLEERD